MVNRHTQGKVIQQNYDDLIATGDGSSLFCLSDRTVKILLATTDFIGWKTRYFSLEDAEIDQDIIDGWEGNVVRELILGDCCCGGQPLGSRLRWSAVGGMLEISYDNGETWIPYPEGDTRETGNLFPPIPGDDGDAKKCEAANNLTNTLHLQWDELIDQLATITTVLGFSAAVADLLIPFGIVTAIPGLVLSIMSALFAAGAEAIDDALTDEQYDKFFCCALASIGDDGAVTEAVWDALGECMGAELEATAALALGLLTYSAGPVGTHNMAQSGTGIGHDCALCGCEPGCTAAGITVDLTDLPDDWSIELTGSGTPELTYIKAVDTDGGFILHFPTMCVTAVHLYIDLNPPGTGTVTVGTETSVTYQHPSPELGQIFTLTTPQIVDQIEFSIVGTFAGTIGYINSLQIDHCT